MRAFGRFAPLARGWDYPSKDDAFRRFAFHESVGTARSNKPHLPNHAPISCATQRVVRRQDRFWWAGRISCACPQIWRALAIVPAQSGAPVKNLPKTTYLQFYDASGTFLAMSDTRKTTSLGDRIATARECNNLTTAQLSRRLGVQTGTITDWQRNASQPRANRLAMLAGILGVSPSWLLVGRGAGPLRS